MEQSPRSSPDHRSPYYIRPETIKALGEYSTARLKQDFEYITKSNPELATHLRRFAFMNTKPEHASGFVAGVVQMINWLEYQNLNLDEHTSWRLMNGDDDAVPPPSDELDDDPPSDAPSQDQPG